MSTVSAEVRWRNSFQTPGSLGALDRKRDSGVSTICSMICNCRRCTWGTCTTRTTGIGGSKKPDSTGAGATYSITGDEATNSFTGAGAARTSGAGTWSITVADATYFFKDDGNAYTAGGGGRTRSGSRHRRWSRRAEIPLHHDAKRFAPRHDKVGA